MALLAPALPTLVPGYRLDRYELLAPIAHGGMATVWVARLKGKHGFEKLFAIKTILPEHASDDQFRTMFLDEARLASRIVHPNVAQILELGEQQGILYIVMEWVDGYTLSKMGRAAEKAGQRIPVAIVLRVVADVCAGLHSAHTLTDDDNRPLHVVHRDMSPQNILVSQQGVAKVIDFGIAKARARMSAATEAGAFKGKLAFVAPEQVIGMAIDLRADVWALGATIHWAMSGQGPYAADNEYATMHKLVSGEPPNPLPPGVPPQVVAIIDRSLRALPEQRFPTALALKNTIEAAMREMRTVAEPDDVAQWMRQYLAEPGRMRIDSLQQASRAAQQREQFEDALLPSESSASDSVQLFLLRPAAERAAVPACQPPCAVAPIALPSPEDPLEAHITQKKSRARLALGVFGGAAAVVGVIAAAMFALRSKAPVPPTSPGSGASTTATTAPESTSSSASLLQSAEPVASTDSVPSPSNAATTRLAGTVRTTRAQLPGRGKVSDAGAAGTTRIIDDGF